MKVFISWSGPRSRHVARALHDWLPDIVQYVEPWMSHENIQAGARWNPEINEQLSQTKFGIICLTPENQHQPWLVFEAGALAKTVDDDTFVVPYLIDMDKSEVKGPLAQFQYVLLDEEGSFGLVQSINKVPDNDAALPGERLEKVFRRSWPDLKSVFDDLPDADAPIQKPRGSDEILREVLELVRDISRQVNRSSPRDRIRAELSVLSEAERRLELARERQMQEQAAHEAVQEAAQADLEAARDAYEATRDAHEEDKYQE
jgi:TIR domain